MSRAALIDKEPPAALSVALLDVRDSTRGHDGEGGINNASNEQIEVGWALPGQGVAVPGWDERTTLSSSNAKMIEISQVFRRGPAKKDASEGRPEPERLPVSLLGPLLVLSNVIHDRVELASAKGADVASPPGEIDRSGQVFALPGADVDNSVDEVDRQVITAKR